MSTDYTPLFSPGLSTILVILESKTIKCVVDLAQLFVYDFQPLAEPLAKHFYHVNGKLKSKYVSNGVSGLNEQLVWNFIIHISSAIRSIHASSMAARCLDLNRILVNSSGK